MANTSTAPEKGVARRGFPLNLAHGTETIDGESGGGVPPNLFDSHPPFQSDGNVGATAGSCEVLVQSHTGGVHLLPSRPKAWPTGKVTGPSARGGFEVEIGWEESRLTRAVIRSKSGLPARSFAVTGAGRSTPGPGSPIHSSSKKV